MRFPPHKRGCILVLRGLGALVALLLTLFWALTSLTDGTIISGGERRALPGF